MKKVIAMTFAVICMLCQMGCTDRSLDDIIQKEPNITGIVKEVHDEYIVITFTADGYPDQTDCVVSLKVQNEDSVTHFNIGDQVVVYYDGNIAESNPPQINTVYAITLKTPADRDENNQS